MLRDEVARAARARGPRPGRRHAGARAVVDQVDDYLLPRLRDLDAPLLDRGRRLDRRGQVDAGQQPASGRPSPRPACCGPTTRAPVLVCSTGRPRAPSPATGCCPGWPARPARDAAPGGSASMVRDDVPAGLALLDAPDVDSVVASNRDLAGQLLAAADLWVFVTTAARYADAVPWDLLRTAAERGDGAGGRPRPGAARGRRPRWPTTSPACCAGPGSTPRRLFVVEERPLVDGRLPDDQVGAAARLAARPRRRPEERAAVVRQTLAGALDSLDQPRRRCSPPPSRTRTARRDPAARPADAALRPARARGSTRACASGSLLRGEVLERWQEFVGTGEWMRGLQARSGGCATGSAPRSPAGRRPRRRAGCALESSVEPLLRAAGRRRRGADRRPRGAPCRRGRRCSATASASSSRCSAGLPRGRRRRGARLAGRGARPGPRARAPTSARPARSLSLRRQRRRPRRDGRGVRPDRRPDRRGDRRGGGTTAVGQRVLEAVFGDAGRAGAGRPGPRRPERARRPAARRRAGAVRRCCVETAPRPGAPTRCGPRRRPRPARRHAGEPARAAAAPTGWPRCARRSRSPTAGSRSPRSPGARAAGQGRRPRGARRRTVVALAGATGSGKSTLFNALVRRRGQPTRRAPADDRGRPRHRLGRPRAGADRLLDWLEVPRRHVRRRPRPGARRAGAARPARPRQHPARAPARGRPAGRARRRAGVGARPAEVRRRRRPRPLPAPLRRPRRRAARRPQPGRPARAEPAARRAWPTCAACSTARACPARRVLPVSARTGDGLAGAARGAGPPGRRTPGGQRPAHRRRARPRPRAARALRRGRRASSPRPSARPRRGRCRTRPACRRSSAPSSARPGAAAPAAPAGRCCAGPARLRPDPLRAAARRERRAAAPASRRPARRPAARGDHRAAPRARHAPAPGCPQAWRDDLRRTVEVSEERSADRLDRAVAGADLGPDRTPLWQRAVGRLQWLLRA